MQPTIRTYVDKYFISSLSDLVISFVDICKDLGPIDLEKRVLSWFNNDRNVLPFVAIPWVRTPLVSMQSDESYTSTQSWTYKGRYVYQNYPGFHTFENIYHPGQTRWYPSRIGKKWPLIILNEDGSVERFRC